MFGQLQRKRGFIVHFGAGSTDMVTISALPIGMVCLSVSKKMVIYTLNHRHVARIIGNTKRGNYTMKYEIVDGNKLCIVIDISPEALKKAIQSKSALKKAAEKGLAASTVPFNLLATTSGFSTIGPVRLSMNVLKA
jgi:hypothetical protein